MMTLTRRNVLVGIALVAVVSGVALGSGAFTQVEATRNVDIGVEGDSDALLSLTPIEGSAIINNTTTGNNGATQLNISNQNLNDDAVTTVEDGITATNNGGQTVDFYVESTSGVGSVLKFEESSGDTLVGSGNAVTLNSGDSVTIDVKIDTLNGSVSSVSDVTFVAEESP